MPAAKKRFVVVTTEHRGVFAGFLNGTSKATDRTVVLSDAQMAVYWSADVGGVLGLASSGPSKGCRISPAVPKLALQGVTAVLDATEDAVKAWQSRPWA
jgi:hypothetical protein